VHRKGSSVVRLALLAASVAGIGGCAAGDPRPAPGAGAPAGRIYHYVRSNLDGSEAERIAVFRRDAIRLEVYKARGKCTDAAFVTAELDLARGQARQLTGGRLRPGAAHEDFAWLTYDPATRRIDARIELPGRTLRDSTTVGPAPWHLFDFDLASLTVLLPARADPTADFSFALPLVWFDPNGGDDFLTDLGRADVRFERVETYAARPALRFRAQGPALGARGGPMWIDKAQGHILGVEWGVPNHREYRDFKLTLTRVDDGGAVAWDKLLRAHFDGCPAA